VASKNNGTSFNYCKLQLNALEVRQTFVKFKIPSSKLQTKTAPQKRCFLFEKFKLYAVVLIFRPRFGGKLGTLALELGIASIKAVALSLLTSSAFFNTAILTS
jgi:hypothetical protein